MIYTGYKLCAPKVWRHIAHIGGEQLFVFSVTVLATLTTDLLWGIAAGHASRSWPWRSRSRAMSSGPTGPRRSAALILRRASQAGELFRNPVVQVGPSPTDTTSTSARPLVCFNALYLNEALARIPSNVTAVHLHVTDLVTMIDHTTTTTLLEFVEEFERSGRGHRRDPRARAFPARVPTTRRACGSARRSWRRSGPRPCGR